MAPRNREVGIRLSVKDADVARRALEAFGKDGQAALKRIEASGRPASVSLQALNAATGLGRSAMTGFFAGATAGLLPLLTLTGALNGARAALDRFGEIDDQARNGGLDPELYQGVAHAAKLAGIEISATASAMSLFAQNSGLAAAGRGRMVTALQALNPELLKNIQLATTQEERLRLAADAINAATSAAEKAALSGALFGNRDFAETFKGGAEALDLTIAKARELGIIIDRETVARAAELGDKLDVASDIIDMKLKRAFVDLAPTMVWLTERIADWLSMLGLLLDQFRDIEQRTFVRPLQNQLAEVHNQRGMLQAEIANLEKGLRDGNLVPDFIEDHALASARTALAEKDALAMELFDRITILQGAPDPNRPAIPPVPTDVPDLPIDADGKAALREAESLIARLRTASEAYGVAVADLSAKRDAGLISQETMNRGLAEAAIKYAGAASGSDEYAAALAALNAARDAGTLSEQKYTAAVEDLTKRRLVAQNDWMAGIELGLLQLQQGAKDVTTDVANAVSGWADSLGTQIGAVFQTGKFAWQDLVKTMLADIAKLATQQLITKPLGNLLGSLFGSALGGGGGQWNIPTGYVAGGFYPGLADGTDYWKGGTTWVGERGPELLNLPRGAQVVPNHKLGGLGGTTVNLSPTYNIDGTGLSPAQLLAVMEQHDRDLMGRVSGQVKKDSKNGVFG